MTRPAHGKDGGRPLVLYDGVCGLCDRSVQFLLREDRRALFTFAALQGETAAAIRRRHPGLDGADSMVLVRDAGGDREEVLMRSTAVLHTLALLGGKWRLVSWLRIVPRPLRDLAYDAIAKRRYRWFGKFESCRLPAAGEAARFLP